MPSIFGRALILPLVNKSGGALAKGDVVVVDTANDGAVTTTTTANTSLPVGVVVEENGIANNATGRVQFGGYVALVTVNASVTRGHYAATHTVAKQATGLSSRAAGSFGIFTTGGTTPAALLFGITDASTGVGGIPTTLIDAAGDLIQGSANDTAARLAAGTAGQFLMAAGSSTALVWKSRELDYVQSTTGDTAVSATTEAGATTIVTGSAVAYDGSTIVMIEFCGQQNLTPATANSKLVFVLYDGSSSLGEMAVLIPPTGGASMYAPVYGARRITPSNASHTYSIRAYGSAATGHVYAGAGGSAALQPFFIRITRAV